MLLLAATFLCQGQLFQKFFRLSQVILAQDAVWNLYPCCCVFLFFRANI